MRLYCFLLTVLYSMRYWMRGGFLNVYVSGHAYIEDRFEHGKWEHYPVEWQICTCERCGLEDRTWRHSPR